MTGLTATALAAATGGVAGVMLQRTLGRRGYRLPDERSLPRRSVVWVAPLTLVLSGLAWWSLAPGYPAIVPAVYVASTWGMVALAAIDLDVQRLPNALQLPAYPAVSVLLSGCSLASGDWSSLSRALAAGGALFALFLCLALVAPAGSMGFGDVKLAGLLGLLLGWLSWGHVIVATTATFLLGGVVAVALLMTGLAGRKNEFAYGPVMLASAVGTIVCLRPLLAALA
ncbi:MAG TPA: prepilin peptidase [Intrasporangium sp.]|uniref:prepilin peptidase n=1 Tax=Intrasporangium sp. TaxID=1925024 RepID=UPI002D77FA69|nr:prepilin peptidase [Intrasporangium sp.]HET7398028.1 prepilin peptidase [Intrasporangium sp.]